MFKMYFMQPSKSSTHFNIHLFTAHFYTMQNYHSPTDQRVVKWNIPNPLRSHPQNVPIDAHVQSHWQQRQLSM